jgi:beta-lactamase class D
MKTNPTSFILVLITLILASCATKTNKPEPFPNKDVCVLVFDLKTSTFIEIVNRKRCEQRFPAASTFKIPLAVMSFDAKVLKDENSSLKWDGKKRFLDAWNADQTAKSWMTNSVVWFSQKLTPKIGLKRIHQYLVSFDYGNADMSGGLETAWLTPSPFNEALVNSLKISGFEQAHFLKNLWREKLSTTPDSQIKAIKLLPEEISENGNKIYGKTGSGFVGEKFDLRIGWYVGYLEAKQDRYVVVANFTDKQNVAGATFGGAEAKLILKQILTERKLW